MCRGLVLLMTSCLVQCVVIQQARGSAIGFQSSPNTVLTGLTSRLILKCDLSDTAASADIVGRRDVSHTPDNMASVSSLIIMKDGSDVASVSPSVAAHVMDGSANVQVSGSVAGISGQRGFLQMTITDPNVNQTGEFTCEANAVSSTGHIVTFSTTVEVNSSTPTLADLVAFVRDLSKKNEDLEKQNEDLKKTVDDLKNKSETAVSFNARLGAVFHFEANQVIVFDVVLENTGNGYNRSNGLFVCKVPGYYDFSVGCLSEANNVLDLDVVHNDTQLFGLFGANDSYHATAANSAVVKLAKGDVVKVVAHESTTLHSYFCTFSGHLVTIS